MNSDSNSLSAEYFWSMFKAHRQASECWAVGLTEVQWSTTRQFWNMFRCKVRSFAMPGFFEQCQRAADFHGIATQRQLLMCAELLPATLLAWSKGKMKGNHLETQSVLTIQLQSNHCLPWAGAHLELLFYHCFSGSSNFKVSKLLACLCQSGKGCNEH